MTALTALVGVASLGNFALFIWSVGGVFQRKPGNRFALRWLELVVGATMVLHLWVLVHQGLRSGLNATLALVFTLAGALLFVWTTRTTRRHRLSSAFCHDVPRVLIKDGPYRYVRHPFYLSYLLTYLGVGLATAAPALCLLIALTAATYYVALRQEEAKFLASPLRQAYLEYRQRTGCLLPRVNVFWQRFSVFFHP